MSSSNSSPSPLLLVPLSPPHLCSPAPPLPCSLAPLLNCTTTEDHHWSVACVEEVHALLDPGEASTIATQDHDGIGLRERINGGEEMPCCDGEYAESQQSDQQECYAVKKASFAVHLRISHVSSSLRVSISTSGACSDDGGSRWL